MALRGQVPAFGHDRLIRLAGYGLGVPAAFWFIQRLALMA